MVLSNKSYKDGLLNKSKTDDSLQAKYAHAIEAIKNKKFTQAIDYFEDILKVEPKHILSLHNLASVFSIQKELGKAEEIFRLIISIKPQEVKSCYNLGVVLNAQQKHDQAIFFFKKTLELEPSHISARHMYEALLGTKSEKPPLEFTEKLFDQFSDHFDNTLCNKLNYQVPTMLSNVLMNSIGNQRTFLSVLDIGCGTGLSGQAFQSISNEITGVDISFEMLAKAKEKNIYNKLQKSDVVKFFDNNEQKYDLVIAADVFVYIGNLAPLFQRLQNHLQKGCMFTFSTEISDSEDFTLQQTGRYAHSKQYINGLSCKFGFKINSLVRGKLRNDGNATINGDYYVLEKE